NQPRHGIAKFASDIAFGRNRVHQAVVCRKDRVLLPSLMSTRVSFYRIEGGCKPGERLERVLTGKSELHQSQLSLIFKALQSEPSACARQSLIHPGDIHLIALGPEE